MGWGRYIHIIFFEAWVNIADNFFKASIEPVVDILSFDIQGTCGSRKYYMIVDMKGDVRRLNIIVYLYNNFTHAVSYCTKHYMRYILSFCYEIHA